MNTSRQDVPSQDAIAERARKIWEAAGSPEGRDLDHWLRAEHELRNESGAIEETASVSSSPAPRGLSNPNADVGVGRAQKSARPSKQGASAGDHPRR